MNKKEYQIIVVIDREFGSGGRRIADLLGMQLQLPVFEKNILQKLGVGDHDDVQDLYYQDESVSWNFAKKKLLKTDKTDAAKLKQDGEAKENEKLTESDLAAKEFDLIRRLAASGESFIILGHCAKEVLREYDCVVSLFVTASDEFKMPRIMKEDPELTYDKAVAKMKRHNWKRMNYHDSYCENKWGYSTNYDLCIASDKLGLDRSATFLVEYLELRFPTQCEYHINKPRDEEYIAASLEQNVLHNEDEIRQHNLQSKMKKNAESEEN